MSEIKDELIYNFYDFMKSIYIYSHVKTSLMDKSRQTIEMIAILSLLVLCSIFFIFTVFKIVVILIYFFFFQATTGFINFLKSLFKTKFKINFRSSLSNSCSYLFKILKRIYTFNFYIYDNKLIGFIMIGAFTFFLLSSFVFYIMNLLEIEQVEKPKKYLVFFYLDFEFTILVELLCTSFYSCRNMKNSTLLGLGFFLVMNFFLVIGYNLKNLKEEINGSYEYEQPQKFMNLIFDMVFLILNLNSLNKVAKYNKNCK